MNISPVVYDDKNKLFVEKFKQSTNIENFWAREECNEIRKLIKDHYIISQNYTCFFCRQKYVQLHNRAWDIEHIISKSSHPMFMFEPYNLCLSCIDCNHKKGNASVLVKENITDFSNKSKDYKIIHPHFDKYEDHIKVIIEGSLYQVVNGSSKGKETRRIYCLDRFIEDAGRNQIINKSPETQKLVAALLCENDENEYEKIERELFKKLSNKFSLELGTDLHSKLITAIDKP
jgi:hypothetical protein